MSAPDSPPIVTPSSDHNCFGCGPANDCGLKLSFQQDGAGVTALYIPRSQDEGFFGIVHGGIVTTMLDEAMAWATYAGGVWAMTARLEVRFRKPVIVGSGLTVHGRIAQVRGKVVETAGEVRDSDGVILAEATATFIRVPADTAAEWERRYFG